MSTRTDIKAMHDALADNTLTRMVMTWANCAEAEISDEGNIWIAQPQTGHWLAEDDLTRFIVWAGMQDIDDYNNGETP